MRVDLFVLYNQITASNDKQLLIEHSGTPSKIDTIGTKDFVLYIKVSLA